MPRPRQTESRTYTRVSAKLSRAVLAVQASWARRPNTTREKERIVMSHQRVAAAIVLLAALLASSLPLTGSAQSSAELFDQVVSGEVTAPLLAGPFDLPLEQQPNILFVYKAGLDVRDFVAHAAFTNPEVDDGVPWDFGFQFRTTGENEDLRIFLLSDGTWNFSIGTDPPEQTVVAPNFDPAPGAVNTLDLIVQDYEAIFGINGEFVASILLPDLLPSGDVYASTGFFSDLSVEGRIIQLTGFTVYGLPGAAAPSAPTQGPVPQARPVTLNAGSCSSLGNPVEVLTDATYPVGEFEGQAGAVVSETSFTRVPRLLEDLLKEPYAINVAASYDMPEVSIACGNVGGVLDELGGFIIGLQEQNGSGYTGVSYLAAENDLSRTNISVFVVPAPFAPAVVELTPPPGVAESVITVEGTPAATPVAVPLATPAG